MRLSVSFQLLTLVLMTCLGQISSSAPVPESGRGYSLRPDDGIKIRATREFVTHATALGMEYRFGKILPGMEKNSSIGVLAQHTVYRPDQRAWNFGGTFTFESFYGAHVDHQWSPFPGEYNEPFYRVGLGGFFTTSEELAALIKIERYQLRLSAGLEDVFRMNRHLRMELLAAISSGGIAGGISMSWAFKETDWPFSSF